MKLYIFLFALIGFTACTSVKEVSTVTTETETIQPITFEVPEIIGQLELPRTDNGLENSLIFEGEPEFAGNDIIVNDNRSSLTKVNAKLKKNDKGKPYLDINLSIKPDSVVKQAIVIKKNTATQTKKETTIENPFKWITYAIFGLVLLVVLLFVFGVIKK